MDADMDVAVVAADMVGQGGFTTDRGALADFEDTKWSGSGILGFLINGVHEWTSRKVKGKRTEGCPSYKMVKWPQLSETAPGRILE